MSNLHVKFEGIKELQESFADAPNEVTGTIHRLFRKIGRFLVVTMKEEQPVGATKKLRQYTNFTIEGIRDLRLVVYDGRHYGPFVRGGTRPHWPPSAPIKAWVVKKFGITGKEADQRAFLIRRRISRRGTKANPYHVRTLNRRKADIEAAAAAEGIKLVATLA